MFWSEYAKDAARTDEFDDKDRVEHAELLALGLVGEVGSVLAEVKKKRRDGRTYPVYEATVHEELGDCLWYSFRVAQVQGVEIGTDPFDAAHQPARNDLRGACLMLAKIAGAIADAVMQSAPLKELMPLFWASLRDVATLAGSVDAPILLEEAARRNIAKREDHYPRQKDYAALFDEGSPAFERLPRSMTIDFVEFTRDGKKSLVVLRYEGMNLGNKVPDDIGGYPDYYRFHDVFHLAHAAKLGWSPVFREMMKCPRAGTNEDGPRARFLEESVIATVFHRARAAGLYEGADKVDYSLLKRVQDLVRDYESAKLPAWRWQEAILEGYEVFRKLKDLKGGRVLIDLPNRVIKYVGPVEPGK